MAKFHLPKLNSWVTPLVLASIGLHGLVLALPMPSLVEDVPETPESPDPDVIQVVTLPKLATAPESVEPPIPEPPPDELPPDEPPLEEPPVEEIVITDPEMLDQVEPEVVEDEFDDIDIEDESDADSDTGDDDSGNLEGGATSEPTLDQRLANIDSYGDYNEENAQRGYASSSYQKLTDWSNDNSASKLSNFSLSLEVPLMECLKAKPANSAIVGITVDPDGNLVGDPELLGKTGYGVLDDQALTLAQAASYPGLGETQSYWIEIQVEKYTLCPTA